MMDADGAVRLEFLDVAFRDGLNVTVRDGYKWDRIVAEVPYRVSVHRTGDPAMLFPAEVVAKLVCPATDIPPELLYLEHSPSARTPDGLWAAMRAAYGDDWTPDRTVTVLVFRRADAD